MKEVTRLTAADKNWKAGEPAPCSYYDENMRLLVREGVLVADAELVSRLLERAVFMASYTEVQPQARPLNVQDPVFDQVVHAAERLGRLFVQVKEGGAAIEKPCMDIAAQIQHCCAMDADAAIAAAFVAKVERMRVIQSLKTAIIVELVMGREGIEASRRQTAVCAALTANIGLYPALGELEEFAGKLSKSMQYSILRHPDESVRLLREGGVADADWLRYVQEHHERQDGSGYPRGLAAGMLSWEGELIGMAESYVAMVYPKKYKRHRSPVTALKEIHNLRGKEFAPEMVQKLVAATGVYPAGSMFGLASGAAVVMKRSANSLEAAELYFVHDKSGFALPAPESARERISTSEIVEILHPYSCKMPLAVLKKIWFRPPAR